MGFQLKLVISSQVTAENRHAIMTAAIARWPFCRGPRDPGAYLDRAVFAPPELTSYLFNTTDEYDEASRQVYEVETQLPEWSRAYPDVTFAFIEADCFGGSCEYYGYCCRNGEVLLTRDHRTGGSLLDLAGAVEIEISGSFDPFVRGFFAGYGSGGAT